MIRGNGSTPWPGVSTAGPVDLRGLRPAGRDVLSNLEGERTARRDLKKGTVMVMGNLPEVRTRRSWCLFQSDARSYAVRLDAVAELIVADGLVRLPLSPPRVLGLFTLRRDVVPVLKMTERHAKDRGGDGAKLVVLILRTEQGVWGIRVDRGAAVAIEEQPDEPGVDDPLATGAPEGPTTIARAGKLYLVIDPDSAWRDVRQEVEAWYGSRCGRSVEPGESAA